MRNRLTFVFVASAISGLLLSGCSSEPVFNALERPATSSDTLPAELSFAPDLDIEKVLLVAEENGKQYYLGRDAASQTLCVAIYPSKKPGQSIAACSTGIPRSGELLNTTGPDQKSTMLVSDGYDTSKIEDSGWKKIHENILTTDF
ncbi:hypothetical protein [Arthrobacter antibioticus]|uniref:hypothetical protein n=1 Tax=Arthrobacter sp. H35-MC1 TaxID=3046203 RepID=UPI0024B960EB|nr:hypothetical protein [Arthrobacter sp. H35-MC1]MDJ0315825.1 hypothetical protein [Arthrobacter sp. H35-MC1]MDJ0318650.1 hypothetical protein [Arthrobacter sp. H35-MC1]